MKKISMKERNSILIVEDMANWRSLLCEILQDNYDVTSVGSYAEALVAISEKEDSFDLAIVDVRLDEVKASDEAGMELLGEISKLGMPAVVVTGYASIRTAKEALRGHGAWDYFDKYAFDVNDFRKTVDSALVESRRQGAREE